MIYKSKIKLGTVVLNVNNLDLQTKFYNQVIGLSILDRTEQEVNLGTAGQKESLIKLVKTDLPPERNYGLFHVAILLPDRPSLATAFKHLLDNQIPLQGGSDHGYSEAIYLEDTEGNGIELYRDKPMSEWAFDSDGRPVGTTKPLEAQDLLALAPDSSPNYQLPDQTIIGHVHLSVPDANASSNLYRKVFGLDEKANLGSAAFIASGTYHHHLAFNHWAGKNLADRQVGQAGLNHLTIRYLDPVQFAATKTRAQLYGMTMIEDSEGSFLLQDPNGIRTLVQSV